MAYLQEILSVSHYHASTALHQVPIVLVTCLKFIMEEATHVESIFRVCAVIDGQMATSIDGKDARWGEHMYSRLDERCAV